MEEAVDLSLLPMYDSALSRISANDEKAVSKVSSVTNAAVFPVYYFSLDFFM